LPFALGKDAATPDAMEGPWRASTAGPKSCYGVSVSTAAQLSAGGRVNDVGGLTVWQWLSRGAPRRSLPKPGHSLPVPAAAFTTSSAEIAASAAALTSCATTFSAVVYQCESIARSGIQRVGDAPGFRCNEHVDKYGWHCNFTPC